MFVVFMFKTYDFVLIVIYLYVSSCLKHELWLMHLKIKNVNLKKKNRFPGFKTLTQNNTKSKRIANRKIQNKESLDSSLCVSVSSMAPFVAVYLSSVL